MSEPRHVPVADAFGRLREMSVRLSEDRQIILGVPPGEAVMIDLGSVEELIEALRDARAEALRGTRWTS